MVVYGFSYSWLLICFVVGYAWAEDKEHCEEYGRMLQADTAKVSARAKKRGLPQVLFQTFFMVYHIIVHCISQN